MVITFTVIAFTTAFALSSRGEVLRLRVAKALDRAGISRKDAAISMRLTEQRLSEALNGKSPLSVFRLAELPDEFWDAFDTAGIEDRGGVVISSKLARLVRGVDQLVMAKIDEIADMADEASYNERKRA